MRKIIGLALGDYRVQAGNERDIVLVFNNEMLACSSVVFGCINEDNIAMFK